MPITKIAHPDNTAVNTLYQSELVRTGAKTAASVGEDTNIRAFKNHGEESSPRGPSMKLTASLFGNIVAARPEPPAAQKLVARVAPGQTVQTVDWGFVRVFQKNASPAGIHFIMQARKELKRLSIRQFADLGIVTPVMRRLATLVRSIVADRMSIDAIVKEAIRDAGYPVDNSMNWSAYLNKMYAPLLAKIPGILKDGIERGDRAHGDARVVGESDSRHELRP
jgi:hypothetical protein